MQIDAMKLTSYLNQLFHVHINHGTHESCQIINEIQDKVNRLMIEQLKNRMNKE